MGENKNKRMKSNAVAFHSSSFIRLVLIILMILVQITILYLVNRFLRQYFVVYYVLVAILSVGLIMKIVSDKSSPSYKIAWILVICVLPISGALLYVIFGSSLTGLREKKWLRISDKEMREHLENERDVISSVEELSVKAQMNYIWNSAGCPAYENTSVEFLSPGEVKYERMLAELEKAEEFIFIEYFIIGSGKMWDGLLEVLERKAKQGVEVRVMWDDFGSIMTLPSRYNKVLESKGIKSCVFNKVVPILSGIHNNRDHRKIMVIDGKVAFTGGINIADEYINAYPKHGYWKDASIVLKGEAVWSFTAMFLSIWKYLNNTQESFEDYRKPVEEIKVEGRGVVQPYCDSPLDSEQVGEGVYLNMINRAEDYVYMQSPYLVIGQEMMVALCNAAKQGVDVRIVTPKIGDHWYVHATTRSNYRALIEAGVRVYEYTPGFIHSKVFVSDDKIATVGTVNMDYRSLYLHFECGALLYDMPVIDTIYDDFLDIVEVSEEIDIKIVKAVPWYKRVVRAFLKLFAPMM